MYSGVATSHKIFFSCRSMSTFSCVQRFFSKMNLVKALLYTQLRQANVESQLHISDQ